MRVRAMLSGRLSRVLPGPGVILAVCLALCLGGCAGDGKETADDLAEARHAMMKRDYLEAERSFERYLRRNPEGNDRWEVWNSLVDLALSVRNDRKSASELLEAMLIEYAEVPARKRAIRSRLAELYRLSRNYARAVGLWSSVAEDGGADSLERAEACRSLAHIYMRRLEFELAKESLIYCQGLEIPDAVRAECLYDLAQTHMGVDELDEAITCLRSVLSLKEIPESKRTLTVFMLADALDQKGENDESMRLFNSIRETYPNPRVVEKRIAFLEKKKHSPAPKNAK